MKHKLMHTAVMVATLAAVLCSTSVQAHGGYDDDYGEYGMMGAHGMMGHGMMGSGHGMMGYGHGMMGGITPYMQGALALSSEQQTQLADIQRKYAKEHWDLMQQMHARGEQMMKLYAADDPDPEALRDAFGTMSTIRGQMLELQARMYREMRGVLTEEQRERHKEMRRFGRNYD